MWWSEGTSLNFNNWNMSPGIIPRWRGKEKKNPFETALTGGKMEWPVSLVLSVIAEPFHPVTSGCQIPLARADLRVENHVLLTMS